MGVIYRGQWIFRQIADTLSDQLMSKINPRHLAAIPFGLADQTWRAQDVLTTDAEALTLCPSLRDRRSPMDSGMRLE